MEFFIIFNILPFPMNTSNDLYNKRNPVEYQTGKQENEVSKAEARFLESIVAESQEERLAKRHASAADPPDVVRYHS
jgi:hypothetical protein